MSEIGVDMAEFEKPRRLRKILDGFFTLSIFAIVIYLIVDGVNKENSPVSAENAWDIKGNALKFR